MKVKVNELEPEECSFYVKRVKLAQTWLSDAVLG